MPYIIKPVEDGFKVCKRDDKKVCFSKKGLPKSRAKKQMAAIGISESRGGAKMSQEEIAAHNAGLEAKRKTRTTGIRCPADRLFDPNKEYRGDENVCINRPDGTIEYVDLGKMGYEPCFVGKNFYGSTSVEKCRELNKTALAEWEKEKHPENYYLFRPALKGLTAVGDILTEAVPMPEIVREGYKAARERTRASIEGYGTDKFMRQLEKLRFSPEAYLMIARRVAQREGYDPAKLAFAMNNDNKLVYDSPEGKRYFGKAGYGDFIIWLFEERNNNVPRGFADQKRYVFRKSHSAMSKKYNLGKYSPNELAINILW